MARHYAPWLALGWSAALLLVPASLELEGVARVAAFALLCPPMALCFWTRADGGGGEDTRSDDPDEPDEPGVDWERFRRDLDDYTGSPRRDPDPRELVPG